jgi:hypothetical protein
MERDKGEYWAVKKLLTLENYPMQDIHHKDTEITRHSVPEDQRRFKYAKGEFGRGWRNP